MSYSGPTGGIEPTSAGLERIQSRIAELTARSETFAVPRPTAPGLGFAAHLSRYSSGGGVVDPAGNLLEDGALFRGSVVTTGTEYSRYSAAAARATVPGLGGMTGVAPVGDLGSSGTSRLPAPSTQRPASGAEVAGFGMKFLGTPYVWGGEDPSGFDCSGLVQYVYKNFGIDLPRVSADQATAGRAVSAQDARIGDLVAFDNTEARPGIDHIGIYLGNGTMLVAPQTGDVVKVQKVDLSKAEAIRRVLPEPAVGRGHWSAALPTAARPYVAQIEAAAASSGLDPRLVAAVAWTESDFRSGAVSKAGATGLMQLMPGTAREVGVDAADPGANLLGGARYLAEQIDRFGRVDLGLAAYNAGPAAVARSGGIPPYKETQNYVTRVLDRLTQLGGA